MSGISREELADLGFADVAEVTEYLRVVNAERAADGVGPVKYPVAWLRADPLSTRVAVDLWREQKAAADETEQRNRLAADADRFGAAHRGLFARRRTRRDLPGDEDLVAAYRAVAAGELTLSEALEAHPPEPVSVEEEASVDAEFRAWTRAVDAGYAGDDR